MRVPSAGLPSPLALAMVSLLFGVTAAGCARSAPTAPDSVAHVSSLSTSARSAPGSVELGGYAVSKLAPHGSASYELIAGTFRVTTAGGDQLTGTYTGRADVSASRPATASLDLRVVSGSGVFQGASGTLRGDGTGAFTGDGTFALALKGVLSVAKPGALNVQTDIVGTSRAACVSGRVAIALQGSGTSNRFSRVNEELNHQVANSGCSS